MTEPVSADSSVILKLTLAEPGSVEARQLLDRWAADERPLVAPSLLAYEVTSALRMATYRERITAGQAETALEAFWDLQIELLQTPDLHRRALELAVALGLPVAYDAHYLAVAEAHGCEFWTADERLFSAVRPAFPLVRLLA